MPQTLIKGARFDSPLEEAVKGFTEPLVHIQSGLGNVTKYAVFNKKPYLLVVSQQIDKLLSHQGYNVLLTVTSYSEQVNNGVKIRFENETGIIFNIEVSESLKERSEIFNFVLPIFEKNP